MTKQHTIFGETADRKSLIFAVSAVSAVFAVAVMVFIVAVLCWRPVYGQTLLPASSRASWLAQEPLPSDSGVFPDHARGAFVAQRRGVIAAPIEGRLRDVFVQPGQRVEPGQDLVRIDCRLALARLDVRQVEADLAALEHQSQQELARMDATSAMDVQRARIGEQRAVSLQNLAKIEARLCQVQASYAAIVVRVMAHPHEWHSSGSPLLEIIDAAPPIVRLLVPGQLFDQVTPGVSFSIAVSEQKGRILNGHVTRIIPRIDPVSQLFEAYGAVESDDAYPVIEGMSGIVSFADIPPLKRQFSASVSPSLHPLSDPLRDTATP